MVQFITRPQGETRCSQNFCKKSQVNLKVKVKNRKQEKQWIEDNKIFKYKREASQKQVVQFITRQQCATHCGQSINKTIKLIKISKERPKNKTSKVSYTTILKF